MPENRRTRMTRKAPQTRGAVSQHPLFGTVCLYCKQPLVFVIGRGWVHQDGGVYAMSCGACGFAQATYPSSAACPRCGSVRQWRDDHVARPTLS